jgi:NTP pyrophosphatase (non-canonical NTP hydrolase)
MSGALDDVLAERERQNDLWGQQDHEPHVWLAILVEEVGEVGKEIADGLAGSEWRPDAFRAELVQATAVGLAALESFDRGLWKS